MTQKPKAKDLQAQLFPRARTLEISAFNLFPDEIVVDNFAGGGGVSEGTEKAIGRPVDIALNHDPEAIAMHAANHPNTRHFCENILEVDPVVVCAGRPCGLAWFAPDCTHHSKAKGSQPRDSKVRGLAYVVIDWAKKVRPRIIRVENVEEFQEWGPLVTDEEEAARLGVKVGAPHPEHKGDEFRAWLGALSDCGYKFEFRCLVAADYGPPTTRKRFFLIARCDGKPIVWPEQTHGKGRAEPWRGAHTIIDWSIPCRSIFGRKKPLAEATLRRIAMGLERYVFGAAEPFLIKYHSSSSGWRGQGLADPLRTIDTSNRFALIEPFIVRHGHFSHKTGAGLEPGKGAGLFRGQPLSRPIATICATNDKHLVVPIITKHYGGKNGHQTPGLPITSPLGAVTTTDHHALSAAFLTKFYGTSVGADVRDPLPTVTGQGQHLGEVRAFLIKYYSGGGQTADVRDPLGTVTAVDRFGLVMVHGEPYQLVDIGMRMLKPRELFNGQDFPPDYIIDPEFNGKSLTQEAQTRLAGNAVPPGLVRAQVAAGGAEAA